MQKIYPTFLLVMLVGSWLGLMNFEVEATSTNVENDKIEEFDVRTQYKMEVKAIVNELMVTKNKGSHQLVIEMILAYLLPKPILESDGLPIRAFTLSPDGLFLFAGGYNLTIWSLPRGNCLQTIQFDPPRIAIAAIVCSTNVNPYTLVTTSIDPYVRNVRVIGVQVWSVRVTGDPISVGTNVRVDVTRLQTLVHTMMPTVVPTSVMHCFLDNRRFRSWGDNIIHVWDAETGTVNLYMIPWYDDIMDITSNQPSVTVSGDSMMCGNKSDGYQKIRMIDNMRVVSASCMTGDGAYAVVAGENEMSKVDENLLTVHILPWMDRVFSMNCTIPITACTTKIEPGNRYVLVLGGLREIQVWHWQPGTLFAKRQCTIQEAHKGKITALRFTPKGEILISASEDGQINMWDITTGTLHKEME